MKLITRVFVVAGLCTFLFLINSPTLTAATANEDIKGGVIEGQSFTETADTGNKESEEERNQGSNQTKPIESPRRLEVKTISPDEAANQINNFFGETYTLLNKVSPQGFVVAIILLAITGPFIGNFFVRLVLSVLCYFVIQKAPFLVGVWQGLLNHLNK